MRIHANNLTFKYFKNAQKSIIENLNITIPKGEITLLAGKSGSGKSTLAYILAGLYPENTGVLESGTVIIDNVDIASLTPDKRVKLVSMMFQNPDLQFCMNNLEQELEFCLENIKIQATDMPMRIDLAIAKLKIDHLRKQPFIKMSGGEKQKCALACIIALESKYIILDEAFANIDPTSACEIIEMLCTLDVTVLAVDHNISLWENKYDNLISLDGSLPLIFDLKANLHEVGKTIIEAKNLRINDIQYPDFQIKKGSIVAIVGRSGAGKTTLFKTLIKQHKYEGLLTLEDTSVRMVSKKKLFAKCGIVFQNPANQFLALSVFDEVLFSVKRWYKSEPSQWQEEKTAELLAMFKLDGYKKYAPYMLSQGQQRRLAVLTMIAGAQDILLLDEPTYGQDYENICIMMQLLLKKAKSGLTVILTTHNMTIAENFAHQIIKIGD